ncbi:uncharacterized protein [Panulirus ornatus]|uniref:uncharacterized protein isoform X1 n=1 Tax=Panulirus ornatus TaxID=150431 RepID=UPI003A88FC26
MLQLWLPVVCWWAPSLLLSTLQWCTWWPSSCLSGGSWKQRKRERALLVWVFVMTLFCFPEMGMVTFMAFVHWKLSTAYGVADLVFYVFRAAFNLLSVLCVQSQYSSWRDEMVNSQVLKRLEHLHVGCVRSGEGRCSESSTAYQNPAFVPLQDDPSSSFHRTCFRASVVRGLAAASVGQPPVTTPDRDAPITRPSDERGPDAGLGYPAASITPGWDACLARDSRSEFNAAMFSPASMGFLPLVRHSSEAIVPAGGGNLFTSPNYYCTQSLDRRRYQRPVPEMMGLAMLSSGRESQSSFGAASDDLGKYRDVAL